MKLLTLIPLMSLVACTSSDEREATTSQDSARMFTVATGALGDARSRAIADASARAGVAPLLASLDFHGPCDRGGAVGVTGSYDVNGIGDRAAFDLNTTFVGCADADGVLDGNLRWTSSASAGGFHGTITGQLDWQGTGVSASCSFDVTLDIGATGIRYAGTVCGYDLATELSYGGGLGPMTPGI